MRASYLSPCCASPTLSCPRAALCCPVLCPELYRAALRAPRCCAAPCCLVLPRAALLPRAAVLPCAALLPRAALLPCAAVLPCAAIRRGFECLNVAVRQFRLARSKSSAGMFQLLLIVQPVLENSTISLLYALMHSTRQYCPPDIQNSLTAHGISSILDPFSMSTRLLGSSYSNS